jgi:hypothetical protein
VALPDRHLAVLVAGPYSASRAASKRLMREQVERLAL